MKKAIRILLSFCVAIILWHLVVIISGINQVLFPTPIDVFTAYKDSPDIFSDTLISLGRLIVGTLIGFFIGIVIGIITSKVEFINETFGQIINYFRFIPRLALVPLFIVWLGIDEVSRVTVVAWTVFFPVWISTFHGVKNIEKKYLHIAKSLKLNVRQKIVDIYLKGSLQHILNGTRIGMDVAFSVLIVAESLGAFSGLGYRIYVLQSVFRIDRMVGYIILLGGIGYLFDRVFLIMSKKIAPWKDED